MLPVLSIHPPSGFLEGRRRVECRIGNLMGSVQHRFATVCVHHVLDVHQRHEVIGIVNIAGDQIRVVEELEEEAVECFAVNA